MGAAERPQEPVQQAQEAANNQADGHQADATAFRQEEAQQLNHELAQDLQGAAAAASPGAQVAPAASGKPDKPASADVHGVGRKDRWGAAGCTAACGNGLAMQHHTAPSTCQADYDDNVSAACSQSYRA